MKNIIRSGVKYALHILSKSEYEIEQESPKKKNLKVDKFLSKSSSLLQYIPPKESKRELSPDAKL